MKRVRARLNTVETPCATAQSLQGEQPTSSLWQLLWHPLPGKPHAGLERCKPVVEPCMHHNGLQDLAGPWWLALFPLNSDQKSRAQVTLAAMSQDWARVMAEISMSLASFRLFLAAGLIKMRVGSPCWKDHTCLYDHYETQPMPNSAAWYFHNYTPRPLLRIMQMFAIDLAECLVPFLLLSFAASLGPIGWLRQALLQREEWYLRWLAQFPARLVASVTIVVFVFGMFIGGNYAFLHPLSLVALVASMGTVEGVPMQRRPMPAAKAVYRSTAPWLTILLLTYAFLPSLRAYATGLVFLRLFVL